MARWYWGFSSSFPWSNATRTSPRLQIHWQVCVHEYPQSIKVSYLSQFRFAISATIKEGLIYLLREANCPDFNWHAVQWCLTRRIPLLDFGARTIAWWRQRSNVPPPRSLPSTLKSNEVHFPFKILPRLETKDWAWALKARLSNVLPCSSLTSTSDQYKRIDQYGYYIFMSPLLIFIPLIGV